MTIPYIDTLALDADACRALAGAHPLCAGYPDGVPETWGERRDQKPGQRGEHRAGAPDPAALLGPISEPVEPRPLVEALVEQLDAMEPMVNRLAGILAAQIENGRDD